MKTTKPLNDRGAKRKPNQTRAPKPRMKPLTIEELRARTPEEWRLEAAEQGRLLEVPKTGHTSLWNGVTINWYKARAELPGCGDFMRLFSVLEAADQKRNMKAKTEEARREAWNKNINVYTMRAGAYFGPGPEGDAEVVFFSVQDLDSVLALMSEAERTKAVDTHRVLQTTNYYDLYTGEIVDYYVPRKPPVKTTKPLTARKVRPATSLTTSGAPSREHASGRLTGPGRIDCATCFPLLPA